MGGRTTELYDAVLNHVVQAVVRVHGRAPSPQVIISDLEMAILDSSQNIFQH